LVSAVLRRLQVGREPQQEAQLVRVEVELLQEAPVSQVDSHGLLLLTRPYEAAGTSPVGGRKPGTSAPRSRRRIASLTSSSTATSDSARPMQMHHSAKSRSVVSAMR